MEDAEKAHIIDVIKEFSAEINEIIGFLQTTKTVEEFDEQFGGRPKPEEKGSINEYLGLADNSLSWWINLLAYLVAADLVDASFNEGEEAVRYHAKLKASKVIFSNKIYDGRPETKDWLNYTDSSEYHELRSKLNEGNDGNTADDLLRIAWLDGWNTGKKA